MSTRRILLAVAGSALGLFLAGCGGPHYETHQIDATVSPTGGSVTLQKISVPLGGAVKAHIVAYDSDHHRMTGGVTTDDATIMNASNVITGDDDWCFLGVSPGTTRIHLQADGTTMQDIEAEVIDVQDVSNQ